MSNPYTLIEYECLKCGHRWTISIFWDKDPFTGKYTNTEPTPEDSCKYWKCGECHVKGKCVVRRKEDRNV